jgi:hypothetical protein
MNPDFQVYAKILKFALIYRNEEGTGLVLTVLQDWCFFMHSQKKFTELQGKLFTMKFRKKLVHWNISISKPGGKRLFMLCDCTLSFFL